MNRKELKIKFELLESHITNIQNELSSANTYASYAYDEAQTASAHASDAMTQADEAMGSAEVAKDHIEAISDELGCLETTLEELSALINDEPIATYAVQEELLLSKEKITSVNVPEKPVILNKDGSTTTVK